MTRTADRLHAAHALLQEYTRLMANGVYVPHALVQRAHRELLMALRQSRREVLQRRGKQQRKGKGDAENVLDMHTP